VSRFRIALRDEHVMRLWVIHAVETHALLVVLRTQPREAG